MAHKLTQRACLLRNLGRVPEFEFFAELGVLLVRFPSGPQQLRKSPPDFLETELLSERFANEIRLDFEATTAGEKLRPRALAAVIKVLAEYCTQGTRAEPHRPFGATGGEGGVT